MPNEQHAFGDPVGYSTPRQALEAHLRLGSPPRHLGSIQLGSDWLVACEWRYAPEGPTDQHVAHCVALVVPRDRNYPGARDGWVVMHATQHGNRLNPFAPAENTPLDGQGPAVTYLVHADSSCNRYIVGGTVLDTRVDTIVVTYGHGVKIALPVFDGSYFAVLHATKLGRIATIEAFARGVRLQQTNFSRNDQDPDGGNLVRVKG